MTEAKAKTVEELYKKAHAAIRKNPEYKKRAEKKNPDRKHKKFLQLRQNAA